MNHQRFRSEENVVRSEPLIALPSGLGNFQAQGDPV